MGIYCLLDFGQKIHWMAPAEGILFLSNLVFIEWSVKLLAALKLLPSTTTKDGILEHYFIILCKGRILFGSSKMFLWSLYNPWSYCCFILSKTGLLDLLMQNVMLTALLLRLLSHLLGAVHPSPEKKWDVLIVRQEVTESGMFLYFIFFLCTLNIIGERYLKKAWNRKVWLWMHIRYDSSHKSSYLKRLIFYIILRFNLLQSLYIVRKLIELSCLISSPVAQRERICTFLKVLNYQKQIAKSI